MMSRDQVEVVKIVYNRFIDSEDLSWTDLDNNMEIIGFLSDEELIVESEIKYDKHSKGVFRCSQEHNIEYCMAPLILEAVLAILELHDETGDLHPKNRYVLSFFITLSEMKMIFNEGAK